jgi:hypothetical protein
VKTRLLSELLVFDQCGKVMPVISLILIIFGFKVLFIQRFGSAVPYWDQWDAEADILLKAYLESNLTAATLISSHNEHRILISRIFSLVLFELDGAWDPILQMIANAVLHVTAIVVLVLIIQRNIRPSQYTLLALFTTFVFVLPIGWENLLSGFQSQFYFLLLFSLWALTGFAAAAAFSPSWWSSVFCSIAAYFSMASGALTLTAALVVVSMQLMLGHRKGLKEYIAAGFLVLLALILIVDIKDVPGHDIYKAQSAAELIGAVVGYLTFPQTNLFLGILVNLPMVVYGWAVLQSRPDRSSPHWIILGIIIWLFAQGASLSYARTSLANSPRYLDLIIVGLPINFSLLLLAKNKFAWGPRHLPVLAAIGWLTVVVPGLIGYTLVSSFPAVLEKGAQGRQQERSVLAYLKTGNLAELEGKSFLAIPYPDPMRLASLLSDATIRLVLPDPISPPDIDRKQRLSRTLIKGRVRPVMGWVKATILNYAHVMIGLGIVIGFGAEMFRQSRMSYRS